jgi:hypothetical protein
MMLHVQLKIYGGMVLSWGLSFCVLELVSVRPCVNARFEQVGKLVDDALCLAS